MSIHHDAALTAAFDQAAARLRDSIDMMIGSYRQSLAAGKDRAEAISGLYYANAEACPPDLMPALLAVAVARLGDMPAVSAMPTVPAGPHAVSTIAPGPDGLVTAVCVCTAVFSDTDEDTAVGLLDAHLVETGSHPADWATPTVEQRTEILAWLNAEKRCFADIMRKPWCSTVMETGAITDEVELHDGSRLVLVDGTWAPKAGA